MSLENTILFVTAVVEISKVAIIGMVTLGVVAMLIKYKFAIHQKQQEQRKQQENSSGNNNNRE